MLILTFTLLALLSTALLFKGHGKAIAITVFLTFIASVYGLKMLISPAENAGFFFGLITSLLSINFILGSIIKKGIWRYLIPIVTIGLVLIFGKNDLNFNGYTLDFSSIKVGGILFIGFLFGALINLKLVFVGRLFPSMNLAQTERAGTLVIAGLFTILVSFLSSWFGFALLAVGFYLYDCYAVKKKFYVSLALLLIALCATHLSAFNLESIDLSIGKVIAGLFIGGGIVAITNLAKNEHPVLLKIILIALVPILIIVLFKLDGVHPAYGGAVSFCALIFGSSLSIFFHRNNRVALFIVTITTFIGLSLAPTMALKKEVIGSDNKVQVKEESEVKFEQVDGKTGIPLEGMSGNYKLSKTLSKVVFQLGPKGGVTKGEITEIEGNISISEELSNSTFSITIPVKQLTTFNEMRDESLMEDIYFDLPKFPLMSFKSDKMEVFEDGYLLKGMFTMLSKTNPQEVFLKCISTEGGKLKLVGKSRIDRTKYGMQSSPQEGDIVDFYFEVEASK